MSDLAIEKSESSNSRQISLATRISPEFSNYSPISRIAVRWRSEHHAPKSEGQIKSLQRSQLCTEPRERLVQLITMLRQAGGDDFEVRTADQGGIEEDVHEGRRFFSPRLRTGIVATRRQLKDPHRHATGCAGQRSKRVRRLRPQISSRLIRPADIVSQTGARLGKTIIVEVNWRPVSRCPSEPVPALGSYLEIERRLPHGIVERKPRSISAGDSFSRSLSVVAATGKSRRHNSDHSKVH